MKPVPVQEHTDKEPLRVQKNLMKVHSHRVHHHVQVDELMMGIEGKGSVPGRGVCRYYKSVLTAK